MANEPNSTDTPATITVTGHVADNITEQIVDAAARQLLNGTSFDEDGEAYSYRNDLAQRLERQIKDTVAEFAAAQAEPVLRELLAKPIPKTDHYGDPVTGAEQTVAEAIGAELQKQLVERGRDHYGNRNSESVLTRVIREQVEDALRTELTAEINKAKAAVKERVTAKAAELLAAESMRAAGVR